LTPARIVRLLFLAVTSATAAELCAVSTLLTYDIYLPYLKPNATEKELLFFDHCAIAAYGVVIAILGIALFYGKFRFHHLALSKSSG
jgi:Na+/proline symporter